VQDCRNCGSGNLRELGFVGEVAPFFLKRVFNMEVGLPWRGIRCGSLPAGCALFPRGC